LKGDLRKTGADYFNESYNLALHPVKPAQGEPTVACTIDKISNSSVTVKSVSCSGEGGPARYALIVGTDYDVFVDGYSKGFDNANNGELKASTDYVNILGTFNFKANTQASATPPPAGPNPTPTPSPTPVPTPKVQSFSITADDSGANPLSVTVTKGNLIQITFNVASANVYHGGLDFRSSVTNSGTIYSGQSKTVSFTADQSFSFTPYWPASNVAKSYKINVVVQ
jgi:hypothetical protein